MDKLKSSISHKNIIIQKLILFELCSFSGELRHVQKSILSVRRACRWRCRSLNNSPLDVAERLRYRSREQKVPRSDISVEVTSQC